MTSSLVGTFSLLSRLGPATRVQYYIGSNVSLVRLGFTNIILGQRLKSCYVLFDSGSLDLFHSDVIRRGIDIIVTSFTVGHGTDSKVLN